MQISTKTKTLFLIAILLVGGFAAPRILQSAGDESDAIGLRVFPNPDHLSPADWYLVNVPNPGSPQALEVDGYEAVQDGRTVYINAVNKTIDAADEEHLYTNIYVFSYSEGASAETIEIYNQLLNNLTFNLNIPEEEQKSALQRDVKRLATLHGLTKTVDDYRWQTGSVPQLQAGSFVPNLSLSVWPSWQATLGNELGQALPLDPRNELIGCRPACCDNEPPDCPASVACPTDTKTCWDEKKLRFACPAESYVYGYLYDSGAEEGLIYYNLEYGESDKWFNLPGVSDLAGVLQVGACETSDKACRNDSECEVAADEKCKFEMCFNFFGQIANDYDADGILDSSDNCPNMPNPKSGFCEVSGSLNYEKPCQVLGENESECDAGGVCKGYCDDQDGHQPQCTVNNDCLTSGDGTICGLDQLDQDGDGLGDACDEFPLDSRNDIDNDGVPNEDDNCPNVYNPGQANSDESHEDENSLPAKGDACDERCQDLDGDKICEDDGHGEPCETNCEEAACSDYPADCRDNCPGFSNHDQSDIDGDGLGDLCERCPSGQDSDKDSVCDDLDNCPSKWNPNQDDYDHDNLGDACDDDSDNDGVEDKIDNCPLLSNASQADSDNDKIGDACDLCPNDSSNDTADADLDKILNCNDSCTDTDGDGLGVSGDTCPLDVCLENAGTTELDGVSVDNCGCVCPEEAGEAWDKKADLIFAINTNLSKADQDKVCDLFDDIANDLQGQGIDAASLFYGMGETWPVEIGDCLNDTENPALKINKGYYGGDLWTYTEAEGSRWKLGPYTAFLTEHPGPLQGAVSGWRENAIRVIIPVSNGAPYNGGESWGEGDNNSIAEAIARAGENKVYVFPVVSEGQFDNYKNSGLADQTGGEVFRFTDDTDGVSETVAGLVQQLTACDQDADGVKDGCDNCPKVYNPHREDLDEDGRGAFCDADETTSCSLEGNAWSANFGWINLAPAEGGVRLDYQGRLSGLAWGSGLGWLNFNGGRINSYGVLTGYLDGNEITGLINLEPVAEPVILNLDTGQFSGYAWAENIGWIGFDTMESGVNVDLSCIADMEEVATTPWSCVSGEERDCTLQKGLCAGSQEICSAGIWQGCDYSEDYESSELTCDDSLDNDCDGEADLDDLDCVPSSWSCLPGEERECVKHEGLCSNLREICSSTGTWPGCDYFNLQDYESSELTCDDSLDNDCDGEADLDDLDCVPSEDALACQTCFDNGEYWAPFPEQCLPLSNCGQPDVCIMSVDFCQCENYSTLNQCLENARCAWCGSENKCVTFNSGICDWGCEEDCIES